MQERCPAEREVGVGKPLHELVEGLERMSQHVEVVKAPLRHPLGLGEFGQKDAQQAQAVEQLQPGRGAVGWARMDIADERPPRLATILGVAGLLPALGGLVFASHAPGAAWYGQLGVLLYATSVLAFLGGLWWGLALAGRAAGKAALMLVAGVALQLGAGTGPSLAPTKAAGAPLQSTR